MCANKESLNGFCCITVVQIPAFKVVGKKVHEFSTRGTGVARRMSGKVITLVPDKRIGQGVAAFGPVIGAVIDAELAFVDVCVAVATYAAGTDATINRMTANRTTLME